MLPLDEEIKAIVKKLSISVTKFYEFCNADNAKMSYYRKNNIVTYKDKISAGIVNFFNLEPIELIDAIKKYKRANKGKKEGEKINFDEVKYSMYRYERLMEKPPEKFKRLVGVDKTVFKKMISTFRAYEKKKKESAGLGGKKGLSPENKVLLMLSYRMEKRTLERVGFDFGVSESVASNIVKEVESVLGKNNDTKKFV